MRRVVVLDVSGERGEREKDRLWDPRILVGKGREELQALKMTVDAASARIEAQLEDAKARAAALGQYAEAEWWRRAQKALEAHRRQSQRIQQARKAGR